MGPHVLENETIVSRRRSIDVSDDSDESGSENSYDSDSLDNNESRKRRRVCPVPVDAPLVPTTSVPSRIKAKAKPVDTPNPVTSSVSAPTDPVTTFESLNVKPWLVKSLGAMAIKRPTGIQKGCIPEILKGRDCIGGSRTGSGKTVAFSVPILQKWSDDPIGIFAVVLTPTR
jgi:ATP-dependent RNA helicase DDX49/DBP8